MRKERAKGVVNGNRFTMIQQVERKVRMKRTRLSEGHYEKMQSYGFLFTTEDDDDDDNSALSRITFLSWLSLPN